MANPFRFQQFTVHQDRCAMKVGIDGVLLGAWAHHSASIPSTILDIGTGTGLLALMLAQRFPQALIDAVELDKEAAGQALENVQASPFAHRVEVHAQSIQNFRNSRYREYDLIVSNPPYYTNSLLAPEEARRLARHTVTLSQADLLGCAEVLLAPQGQLCLILPRDIAIPFAEQAGQDGWSVLQCCVIQARPNRPPNRCLLQLNRDPKRVVPRNEQLIVYAEEKGKEWSAAFKQLTQQFYLSLADDSGGE